MSHGPPVINQWRGDAEALAALRPASTGVPFLRQLLQLVEGEGEVDVRHILFWSKNGRYLVICDEADFFEKVCKGVVFNQKSISNFNKQMNNWRWRRVARKDVVAVASRDDTIWNDHVRLWEHPTLTRDSTDREIDAVTRQPDGMAKKRRLLGRASPPIPRPLSRRPRKPASRRRLDSESEAEETELEEYDEDWSTEEVDSRMKPSYYRPERRVPILALQEPTPPIPDRLHIPNNHRPTQHFFDFPERTSSCNPEPIRADLLAPPPRQSSFDEAFWPAHFHEQVQPPPVPYSYNADPLYALYNHSETQAPPSQSATPLEALGLGEFPLGPANLIGPTEYPHPDYLRPPSPIHPPTLPEHQYTTVSPINTATSSSPVNTSSPPSSHRIDDHDTISHLKSQTTKNLFKGVSQRQNKNLKCISPDRLRGRQSSSSSFGGSTQMLPDQNTPTRATFGFGRFGDLADFLDGMCNPTPPRKESGVCEEHFDQPWFPYGSGGASH